MRHAFDSLAFRYCRDAFEFYSVFLMKSVKLVLISIFVATALAQQDYSSVIDKQPYLSPILDLCKVKWPENRTINVVCHGHSVPSGYFKTPEVDSLQSYPNLLRIFLAKEFPHAVINVIVTGIGGESSDRGAARFATDVLNHKPDVITIDYALNDRAIGLVKSRESWEDMIKQAKSHGIKVLLLTPTPDMSTITDGRDDVLLQHAEQIRQLAQQYNVGLVDSFLAFQNAVDAGEKLEGLMSQSNHPNAKGHKVIADRLMRFFKY